MKREGFMKKFFEKFKLINYLAKANLKKENKATSLGYVWIVLAPLITAITYGIVFGIIFGGKKDGIDSFPWQISGFFPWYFLADSFTGGAFSLVNNRNLVTKLVFPLELLTVIEFLKNSYKLLILIVITAIILMIYQIYPTIYWLQLIYAYIASFAFIYGITLLFSALIVLYKDLGNFINSIMQMLFWASGVVWSIYEIDHAALSILKINPFLYLVNVFRNSFLGRNWFWEEPRDALIFWGITIICIILGRYLFKKNRKDFADFI